jgi:hypothetical protein
MSFSFVAYVGPYIEAFPSLATTNMVSVRRVCLQDEFHELFERGDYCPVCGSSVITTLEEVRAPVDFHKLTKTPEFKEHFKGVSFWPWNYKEYIFTSDKYGVEVDEFAVVRNPDNAMCSVVNIDMTDRAYDKNVPWDIMREHMEQVGKDLVDAGHILSYVVKYGILRSRS